MSHAAPQPAPAVSGAIVAGVVALAAIVVGGLVGLYALAPVRPDLSGLFNALTTGLLAAGAAVGTWVASRKQLRTVHEDVRTTVRQTNGELTERIRVAVAAAMASEAAAHSVPGVRGPVLPADVPGLVSRVQQSHAGGIVVPLQPTGLRAGLEDGTEPEPAA